MDAINPLKKAIDLHHQGLLTEAEQAYLDRLTCAPDDTDAMCLLGILHAQQKHYPLAITWFEKVLLADPESALAHNHLANCLGHQQQTDAAIEHLEKALKIQPNYPEALNNFGNIFRKQHKFIDACNAYKAAINLKPNYVDAYINLGSTYFSLNEVDQAQYFFQLALQYAPNNPVIFFQLGNIAYQQNNMEAAAEYYAKAPLHMDALLNLGAVLLKLNQPEAAIEKFQHVLQHMPRNILAHSNLAALYLTTDKLDQALYHYYEIVSLQPEDYTAHFNLGVIFMQQRKWETALYHFHTAVHLQPADADAHINYATTLLKLQRDDEAILHYRTALELRPDDAIAAYRLATLCGEHTPTAAPKAYIEALFDNYAAHFDYELMESLQYKAPARLYEQTCLYLGDRFKLKIVDLGCGTGLGGRAFMPRSSYLAGVDLSQKMLDIAEKKHIYDALMRLDMIEALQYWKNELDVITATDAVVYLGDLTAFMASSFQALQAHGLLSFTTEATTDADYKLRRTGRYAHHNMYIETQAKNHGFIVHDILRITLREQKGEPVYGWLVVLEKPA